MEESGTWEPEKPGNRLQMANSEGETGAPAHEIFLEGTSSPPPILPMVILLNQYQLPGKS